jgi:hypothetical protein
MNTRWLQQICSGLDHGYSLQLCDTWQQNAVR